MKNISKQSLKRLPVYLNYLKSITKATNENISATLIAQALQLNDVQVRKDLAMVCSSGKPKTGYLIADLVRDLEEYLGYNDTDDAVLVGAGKLGKALMGYEGFLNYGLNILVAFDVDENIIDGRRIMPLSRIKELCGRLNVHIGIITTPASCAQEVCNLLVDSGITAIWNFAPTHLIVPEGVLVQDEDMASSLALLSRHLKEKMNQL